MNGGAAVEGVKAKTGNRGRQGKLARYALVFDTETTIDTTQALTFGFYRFCELQPGGDYVCLEEGAFHADDLDQRSLASLRRYVLSNRAETYEGCPKRVRLYPRSVFIEKVFFIACKAGAVVVAFNLPFDLSAWRSSTASRGVQVAGAGVLSYRNTSTRRPAGSFLTAFVPASSFAPKTRRRHSFAWRGATAVNRSVQGDFSI